jgi:hypothetical protein
MTPRMHWTLRILLATIAGFLTSVAIWAIIVPFLYGLSVRDYLKFTFWNWRLPLNVALMALPIFAFLLLTRLFAPPGIASGETYCRACRAILRHLAQPRCPECGESI